MDLSKLSTEELMRMRAGDAQPAARHSFDLSQVSSEDLMKMRGSAEGPTGSFWENTKAGAGKIFYDIARGAGQIVRERLEAPLKNAEMLSKSGPQRIADLVAPRAPIDTNSKLADAIGLPNQADIDEAKRMDEPLMQTGGGILGNIVSGATLLAPTALIPGAATPMGAGIIGGVTGAIQPVPTGGDRLTNAAVGTAVAGATQAGLNKLGSVMAQRGSRQAAQASALEAQNATRDAALKAGQQAGYVAPPASVKPGLVNEAIESVGGKVATAQTASAKNQVVTDTLARQYLGMADDAILSKASIADAKKIASAPYREIAAVSDDAAKAMEAWKQANFDAKMQWTYFRKSGNPEAYAKAQELGKAAEAALDAVEAEAARATSGVEAQQLVAALKAARVKLAKIGTIESAMTSGGHVDANVIAKMGERFPFTDQLKIIADFAGLFPKAMRSPEKIGGAAHALRPGIGAGVGTLIGGPAGGVAGAATGVAVPWTVRQMMLSGAGQAALTRPSYAAGGGAKTIAELLESPLTRAVLPQAANAAALQNRAK